MVLDRRILILFLSLVSFLTLGLFCAKNMTGSLSSLVPAVLQKTLETGLTPPMTADMFSVPTTVPFVQAPFVPESSAVITLSDGEMDILVQTVWAEARGEGYEGMRAVAEVIINRVLHEKSWGNCVKDVALQRKQFSCWNARDPNLKKIKKINKNSASYRMAEKAATEALQGSKFTNGATHYHTKRVRPRWARAQKPLAQINRHKFYKI